MKRVTTYLKLRVLAAIDYAEGSSREERIKRVAETAFTDEQGMSRQFTWRTIQTWYSRYQKHGITSMESKKRSDSGASRKITPEELLEAIGHVLPLFRGDRYNKRDIYRKLVEKGIVSPSMLAQTTFYRFVKEHELLSEKDGVQSKRRLAFAMQYANQLWQGDSLYGPYIHDESGTSVQTRLIAFIDDASRVLTHGQFFFTESIDSLITTLRSAFYKRGVPEQIYVDNGSIYTSKEITLICARLGCILRHAPLRDGASKGKIERFFHTVREQFLSRSLDLSSLQALNRQFSLWVEDEYNGSSHSGIGMKPVDRFAIDLGRIRFLPPSEVTDELFYDEETRMVKKDNTFSFKAMRYETPSDLRERQISIRFDRFKSSRLIVYYKGERVGQARQLDLIANGLIPRPRAPRTPTP
jgi:transposase InsO family protein